MNIWQCITAPTGVRLGCILVSALLLSCGGGDVPSSGNDASSRKAALAVTAPTTFFPPNVTIPTDADTRGMWSPVYNWPGVAVHAVVLPDGRVLTYGSNTSTGQQTGFSGYDIWDSTGAPDAGHLQIPNGTGVDIFCSSNVMLPATSVSTPASVFIAGGDLWTGSQTLNQPNPNSTVLDVQSGVLSRKSDMQRPRWYSTSTTLINGETYIQGGNGGTDRPEIRGLTGVFRVLSGADTSGQNYYFPRNFVAPDGRIFGYDSTGQMYYVNTAGSGSFSLVGQFSSQFASQTGSAAMFRPGRILQLGGNSNGAVIIDISGGGTPSLTPTQSLSSQRQWVNATILADGKVLATGGSQNDPSGGANPLGANHTAEIWDPTTGQWMRGPAAAKDRLYHSNAVLLPDASVLVSGSGALNPPGQWQYQLNAEIYYPPYFFAANGQRASRPIIASAPDWVDIGTVIPVSVANAASVSRVTLVKTSATTHSFNMDQRFLDLPFHANGLDLSVQAPTRAADATPGYYMLFVFDGAGVPSVAKIVRMGIAAVANPAIVPTLTNPGTQTGNVGTAASLALAATDPNGDVLSYSATGLPAGLTINAATGVISGSLTTAGDYNVVVSASDGVNVASAGFVWSVTAVNGIVIDPLPPVAATQAGTTTTFTASTHGGVNVLYSWNFGDNTGDTAWSSSPTISHSFANPGTYSVTFSAKDDSQIVQSRTFLQTVYLPTTPNKPSLSSNILVQTPSSGNPRVWIVNQDNDSVSAFDTVTRVKLAEIAVGTAPRSIALAPNGLIWVANKRSDSISVINPSTSAVVNTIGLPRASQPFGIAMSPNSAQAFVVLEATGQLLKFDTVTYAQLGSAAVGANARQLSVSADGASVYVSRFITPPLPGESTATVTTTPSNGAEVVVVSAIGMSLIRTIVLQHSDKVDFENQGRGIPNYVGAAAISPDGTQAWVPSKQDNIKRGTLRDGTGLNFQNTVRAISSRIALATNQEDLAKRIDHDNSSVASAAAYDSRGVLLFVALETSREVAVIDAHSGSQVMRFDVGRAPQGLVLSPDDKTLFVNNFMDRTVGVYDLQPLTTNGQLSVPLLATLSAVGTEKLPANVLLGKQHFYDARDTRLARDRYMSCASCHNDGGSDGRTWDFTGQGEGLRNTIALRGRAGAQGLLHWSGNFDEVQDFEGQIRSLSGGTGLMSDAAFNTGTRSQPLGDPKAGVSPDLDALAAYVGSLNAFDPSPYRNAAGALSSTGSAGLAVFVAQGCAVCHGGTSFTNSGVMGLQNIGTLKPSSGQRLGSTLTGIDIPTLRDVWRTGPYLHDGSAATLDEAVLAHNTVTINSTDLTSLAEYLREIGSEEASAPSNQPSGLVAAYGFNEGAGTVLTDLSGKGNNGTLSGATWTTAGKYGNALVFNGTNAQVTVPNSSSLQLTTGMTLEAWVYPTATQTYWHSVLAKNVDGYYLMASTDQSSRPGVGGTWAAGGQNTIGTSALTVNTWTHLAATFDGATVRLYVNGVQVASQAQTTPLVSTTGTLQIGADGYPGEFFAGRIDEIRIYNRALSAAELGTDMNTPLAPVVDTTPPVLSNAQPSGVLALGTTQTTLSVTSNENATCRYATAAGTAYSSMGNTFGTTGGTTHTTVVSGLANGQSYAYYVRCQDTAGNPNTADLAISFSVAAPDTTPPTVSVSAPTAGATVTGTISVSANASDNVAVAGVQFLLDGVNLGAEVTAAPYTVSWSTTGTANGAHTISARARDAAGNQTTSVVVSVTVSNTAPDTTPPTVSVSAPTAGATVTGTISVSANASDNVAVAGVQFLLDGVNLGAEVTAAPYTVSWSTTGTANGAHTISARARDAAGNQTTSVVVSVTVSNTAPDTTPPTVSVSAPTAGATVTGTISVSANASDNVAVAGVQFLLDGVNLGAEVTAAPYTVSWSTTGTANGAHTISARARDAAGNQTTSVVVSVTVSNTAPDTTPPTVSVSAPTAGATVTGTISVSANASDNVAVAGVQFLLDGTNLGAESTAAPYTVSWNTTGVANGAHSISARARDAAGNQTVSAVIGVTVSNAVPSGLVAAYGFNEGAGTVLTDLSGKGNNGTLSGATWTTAGKYGNALVFNGTNAQVTVPNSSSLQLTTGMTLEAWVYPTATQTYWHSVLAKNVDGYYLMASTDQSSRPGVGGTWAAGGQNTIGTSALTVNTWTHLAATFDGATVRLYVNGVQVASQAQTTPLVSTTGTLQIGADGYPGEFFAGRIDEIRIYNRALSAAELGTDMNTPLAPVVDTTPPVLSNAQPSGVLALGTTQTTLSVTSNENATCRYATAAGTAYSSMGNTFGTTGGTTHTTVVSGLANGQSYAYYVRCQDTAGNPNTADLAISFSVAAPDTTPPTVSVSAPTAGATVTGTISVSANASDNVAVAGVQFLLDGVNLGAEVTAAPYTVSWSTTGTANGAHTISARARDAAGNQTTSVVVSVTVSNTAPDTTPPTVSVSAPTAGATVTGTISVSANASDNVAVAGVQFLLDGVNLGAEVTAAPYTVSWSTTGTANGAHTISARARDAAGNQTTSVVVSVTVSNTAPDTTPPTVSVSAPTAGATVTGTISVSANASDNVAVAGVQFLLDGTNLGAESTAAPYTVSWNTTGVANGAHSISARARDAAGNQTVSAVIGVTVSNAVPSGLVAAYGFNEGAGTVLTDLSGKGNNGTLSGATWTTAGKYGNALVFNGTNAQVTVPNSSSLQLTTGMTLEAWVYPTATQTYWHSVLAKNVDGYYLMASTDQSSRPGVGGTWAAGGQNTIGTSALTVNTWTHLAATFDGATVRLYVNGVQVASQAQTTPLVSTTGTLQIGADGYPGEFFAGRIDEIRIYNRALSAAELGTDMNTPVGP